MFQDNVFRLIIDPPRSAALNMAIDEFLMNEASKPRRIPVLRIYSWEAPSYSVGYFQKIDEVVGKIKASQEDIAVVRRLTGGGWVFHGEDLTFSLVIRYPNPFFSNDTKSSYLKINEALMMGFRELHPKLDFADCKTLPSGRARNGRICFELPACYDLLLRGKKVVGASQRRSAGVVLHQSAVFLGDDKKVLTGKILEGFREKWKIDFEELPLSNDELEKAREIEKGRYSSPEWAIS
ncbi:MAG: hypothetical protein A3C47_05535 [Omnitrophica bacterium RIFCSPHIGHO2_02_FULL_51_18]|nr:MAG: hypothetical protein A3C47_05535 [Omnitrophica bacterium RIFCSPHIGHO2_02_FULL_51_18]